MTHNYESKLHTLGSSQLSPHKPESIDSLTDMYTTLFTQLQTDIVNALPTYATKNIPANVMLRSKLEYKVTSRGLCYISAPHTQLLELNDKKVTIAAQMMGMLEKFKRHQPIFSATEEENVQEEIKSPYAYCFLPEPEFKQYRQRMIDSIEQRFGAGRTRTQLDNPGYLQRPPSPQKVEQITVESYVHLTSSSCRSSVYVNFEDTNGLSLDAQYRLFRSVIKRDAQGKIERPASSKSNPSIVYFTPQIAHQLVKHDISDVGSLMPLGLLAVTHLSMVKKMLRK